MLAYNNSPPGDIEGETKIINGVINEEDIMNQHEMLIQPKILNDSQCYCEFCSKSSSDSSKSSSDSSKSSSDSSKSSDSLILAENDEIIQKNDNNDIKEQVDDDIQEQNKQTTDTRYSNYYNPLMSIPKSNVPQVVTVNNQNFGEKNFSVTSGSYLKTGNTNVYYTVFNQIQIKCFSSTITFSYNPNNIDAIYIFENVDSLWGNVVDGLSMVDVNGKQSFYSFETGFDAETKTLTLKINDNNGNVLKLNGRVTINLIIYDCIESALIQQQTFSMPLQQTYYVSRP
jgi:hypothetical protein